MEHAKCGGPARDLAGLGLAHLESFRVEAHRTGSFQISNDPCCVDKVRDVVGLYMGPPGNALVLCVDEKSQIRALERSQPVLPLGAGKPEGHTPEYFRHGTISLFAALDVKKGEVVGGCHRRHRAGEFLPFLREIEKHVEPDVADGKAVHLILDNYCTHKSAGVMRWLVKRPHWHLHFTPTHASWLMAQSGGALFRQDHRRSNPAWQLP